MRVNYTYLVTSTNVLEASAGLHQSLGNVRALLLDSNKHVAGLVVKALAAIVIPNLLDLLADNLLEVQLSRRGDFTKDHDHSGLGGRFASNLAELVHSQAGIDDGIRPLIANLVYAT